MKGTIMNLKQASARVTGMTRAPDLFTSIAAAETVSKRKSTIRELVIMYAESKAQGFTDDDLREAFRRGPDGKERPESSYRKRRTELTEERIILPLADHEKNRAGNEAYLWIHRDFVLMPPPIRARQQKPSRFALLQEENARLKVELSTATRAERAAVVAWLRDPHRRSVPTMDARWSAAYNACLDNAAEKFERGEHRP